MLIDRTWIGVDDPGRTDRAVLSVDAGGIRGHGSSTTAGYALAWRLDVDERWTTRLLEVAVQGDGWSRSLRLERSDAGRWRADAEARGERRLPPPGLADPDVVAGAVDCDLGLCPVTNTMPIRRLGLLDGPVAETAIVAAWVEVPSLRVLRDVQLYASDAAGRVQYASADRSFAATLTIDADGVVLDYEGLARVRDP
ncbi:putative glycolipid-binding domain-containing protein [Agrococcus sp. DT81.2]|uniref:putative glycolipid-binding domain-containing protein n=1 Tax=Agrococcus sp. DT81.2 TaxID=3393414 RepID=UPI003CE51E54